VVWNLHADREVLLVAQEKVVGFSPNGATLATGSFLDEGFTLVDVAAGTTRAVDELPWDGQPQEGAQDDADPWVAAHGGLGASIAFDGTVTLWDTQRRQPLGTVAVPGAFDFSALAFDPTGGRLAVASPGGALSLIDTDVMSWRAKACALAARSLTRAEWNQFFGPTVAYAPAC
jgi:WD40 repeat protein